MLWHIIAAKGIAQWAPFCAVLLGSSWPVRVVDEVACWCSRWSGFYVWSMKSFVCVVDEVVCLCGSWSGFVCVVNEVVYLCGQWSDDKHNARFTFAKPNGTMICPWHICISQSWTKGVKFLISYSVAKQQRVTRNVPRISLWAKRSLSCSGSASSGLSSLQTITRNKVFGWELDPNQRPIHSLRTHCQDGCPIRFFIFPTLSLPYFRSNYNRLLKAKIYCYMNNSPSKAGKTVCK